MDLAEQITEQDIEEVLSLAEDLVAKIEADPRRVGGDIDEILASVFRVLRRWVLGSFPQLDALIARRNAVLRTPSTAPPLGAFATAYAAKRRGPK